MSEFADWTRAFVMMAHDGTVYRPVLVDDLGNLYALLQGETVDDELRTVRLDDQGRISAFVIDSVDAWGQMLSIGNAELAARLGSPVLYEQSGRVQFIETFERGIARWTQTIDGGGAAIALSPAFVMSGGYSAKLTGGRDEDRLATIKHTQGGYPIGAVGIAFAYSDSTDFDSVTAQIYLYNGTDLFQLGVRLDGVSDKLKVRLAGAGWEEVGDANPHTNGTNIFFFVKLTGDLTTGYYKELRFNQEVIDLSAIEFFVGGSAPPVQSIIELTVVSVEDENDIVYFDDIILTLAEP